MCSTLPFLGATCHRTRSCNDFWSNALGLCRAPSSEKCSDYDDWRGRLSSDQAGKAQLVADAGNVLTWVDSGLTKGEEYCYKVTSYQDATCVSAYSNIVCAIPSSPGQATDLE